MIMEHAKHRAGTRVGCPDCAKLSYEPGWYATLLSIASERDPFISLPAEEPVRG